MKSMDDILDDIKNDPIKLKRVFTIIWVAAYGMLVLGAFLIIWILLQGN